jgi:hypothetical protein
MVVSNALATSIEARFWQAHTDYFHFAVGDPANELLRFL